MFCQTRWTSENYRVTRIILLIHTLSRVTLLTPRLSPCDKEILWSFWFSPNYAGNCIFQIPRGIRGFLIYCECRMTKRFYSCCIEALLFFLNPTVWKNICIIDKISLYFSHLLFISLSSLSELFSLSLSLSWSIDLCPTFTPVNISWHSGILQSCNSLNKLKRLIYKVTHLGSWF